MASGFLMGVMGLGLVLGIPIALAIGISGILYLVIFHTVPISLFAEGIISGTYSFTLLGIPFFILSGEIMLAGGISTRLIDFCMSLSKGSRAALGIVTVYACMIFGAISGSGAATVACIGGIMIPQMVKNGYDKGFATALTSSAGALGPIIPPSILFLVYGVSVQVSVTKLFLGGFIPGVAMAIVLAAISKRMIIKENYLPSAQVAEENKKLMDITVGGALRKGIWALLMPVIILGGIYGGIFTPTEAAIVASAYALIISVFVYKEVTLKSLPMIFIKTARSCGFMYIITICFAFSKLLAIEGVGESIANSVLSITDNKYIILLLINIFLLLVGMVMDAGPAIVILAPILARIVQPLGVDLVHFGIIMCINLSIGLVTPPVGINLFVGLRIAGIPMERTIKYLKPLLVGMIVILLLVTYLPGVTLFLPNLLG